MIVWDRMGMVCDLKICDFAIIHNRRLTSNNCQKSNDNRNEHFVPLNLEDSIGGKGTNKKSTAKLNSSKRTGQDGIVWLFENWPSQCTILSSKQTNKKKRPDTEEKKWQTDEMWWKIVKLWKPQAYAHTHTQLSYKYPFGSSFHLLLTQPSGWTELNTGWRVARCCRRKMRWWQVKRVPRPIHIRYMLHNVQDVCACVCVFARLAVVYYMMIRACEANEESEIYFVWH